MSIFNNITYASGTSTAAVIVSGRNANGLTEWKLKDETTLKDFKTDKK